MSKKDYNRNPVDNNQWLLRSDEELQKIYANLSEKQLEEKRKRQKKWYDNQKDKA